MISLYQRISPLYHALGRSIFGTTFACRFEPTCSQYAKEALAKYGIIQGTFLALKRFFRCHPFAVGGYDPVPKN